jgi:hypothetical protein
MIDAGLGEDDPLFAQTLDDLRKLEQGEPLTLPAPQATAAEPGPETSAQDPEPPQAARGKSPASRPLAKKPDARQSAALALLRKSRGVPKAVARAIHTLGASAPDVLQWANTAELCKWMTVISSTGEPFVMGEQAVRVLSAAMLTRAQKAPRPGADELASMLLALGRALAQFPLCAELKPAISALCGLLAKTSIKGMRLDHACNAVQGFAPLLADQDENALAALEHMSRAAAGGKPPPSLQAEGFQTVHLGRMFDVLGPLLARPEVMGLLQQLSVRLAQDKTVRTLPKRQRAEALAILVAGAPAQSAAVVAELANALAKDLAHPPVAVRAEDIGTSGTPELVHALLQPHWLTQSEGKTLVTPPDDAKEDLVVSFLVGKLEEAFRMEKDPQIDLLEHLPIWKAFFAFTEARIGSLSGPPAEAGEMLSTMLLTLESGGLQATFAKAPDWERSFTRVFLMIAQVLMGRDRDTVRQILSTMSPKDQGRLLDHLDLVERYFGKSPEEAKVFADMRDAATALRAMLAGGPAVPGATDTGATGGVGLVIPQAGSAKADDQGPNVEAAKRRTQLAEPMSESVLMAWILDIVQGSPATFDSELLGMLVPRLAPLTFSPAGRYVVQALTQHLEKSAAASKGLLERPAALQLAASIASNVSSAASAGPANECLFALMGVILTQCSRPPAIWNASSPAEWKLGTLRGRARFAFKILSDHWKQTGGTGYAIPADAPPALAATFAMGMEITTPSATLTWDTKNAAQSEAIAVEAYHLLADEQLMCKSKSDVMNLLGRAMRLLKYCFDVQMLEVQDRSRVEEAQLLASVPFANAILAWGDARALVNSLAKSDRPLLAALVNRVLKLAAGEGSALREYLRQPHINALTALAKHLLTLR